MLEDTSVWFSAFISECQPAAYRRDLCENADLLIPAPTLTAVRLSFAVYH